MKEEKDRGSVWADEAEPEKRLLAMQASGPELQTGTPHQKAKPDGLLLQFQLWGRRGWIPGALDNLSYSVAQAVNRFKNEGVNLSIQELEAGGSLRELVTSLVYRLSPQDS